MKHSKSCFLECYFCQHDSQWSASTLHFSQPLENLGRKYSYILGEGLLGRILQFATGRGHVLPKPPCLETFPYMQKSNETHYTEYLNIHFYLSLCINLPNSFETFPAKGMDLF